jgi:hypothetical protein
MISLIESVLNKLDRAILKKYEDTLAEIAKLRYVHDAESKKTYLSGKLEAYEEISAIIKAILITLN